MYEATVRSLQERLRVAIEEASEGRCLMVGTERKPRFGEKVRGVWASPSNPQRDGIFVEVIRRTGRVNPGKFFRLTDGRGAFWEYPAESVVYLDSDDLPAVDSPARRAYK